MTAPREQEWAAANQRRLSAEFTRVRGLLQRYVGRNDEAAEAADVAGEQVSASVTTALDYLCSRFALSPFERDIVVVAAGIELDAAFAPICAAAHADARRNYLSFGLALAALPDAHWSGLSPDAPLRRWHLCVPDDGPSLVQARLRIDERVLHFLVGINALDPRLSDLVQRLAPAALTDSQRAQVDVLRTLWERRDAGSMPVRIVGTDVAGAKSVVAMACARIGVRALAIRAQDLPAQATERALVARLLARECALQPGVVVVEGAEADAPLGALLGERCPLALLGGHGNAGGASCVALEVDRPQFTEAHALWRAALGDDAIAAEPDTTWLERLVAHFELGADDIGAAAVEARRTRGVGETTATAVWRVCRARARGSLDALASRIEPRAMWDDLVVPVAQLELLREIASQVRHRATVYQHWGFASKGGRGLGVSALFTGESGTGKTLAAEVLANELRLDLYRIDLSAVVSKYIGETEKNLKRVFDGAEASGAVLLFDEADALFGRRSEVKDSHDRYANIELAYLLQRIEAYSGLAILTTNMKGLLDTAFLRRIRFVVQFPFPDARDREAIWRRMFPPSLPREGIRIDQLARLSLSGGNIRNIALNAAFLAADEGSSLAMRHLLRAARVECSKLEKPLTEAEIGGWR